MLPPEGGGCASRVEILSRKSRHHTEPGHVSAFGEATPSGLFLQNTAMQFLQQH
jgi:hypothetical protein